MVRPKRIKAGVATDTQPDLALARRCRHDPLAQRELFDSYVDDVYGLAYRLVGRASDAQDVVQEAFVEIYRCLDTYRGEASLQAWLHRIAVRVAVRHQRKASKRRDFEVVDGQISTVATAPDLSAPSEALAARAALRRLQRLLDKIAPTRRAVFVLHEVEGYTLPEAAALLNISVTAAQKRLCRARSNLEQLIKGDEIEEFIQERIGKDG